MMDWFKRDVFTNSLAVVTALLLLGAVYYALSSQASLAEETEKYNSQVAALSRLWSARPFPNEENLSRVSDELEETKKLLDQLASLVAEQSAPINSSLSPQQFQDSLTAKVGELTKQAKLSGTILPEDFYLGFGEYRTQPPSADAAPLLGQQLESIANIALLITKAGAIQITAINRERLPVEAGATAIEGGNENDQSAAVTIAPFDIAFVSNQTVFRSATAAVINATPMVFVRLVSVANSQPVPPPKAPQAADATATEESLVEKIPVVFGNETLLVTMRLASVSTGMPNQQP